MTDHGIEHIKASIDYTVAPGAILASYWGHLPEIAAVTALLWYMIRIWETCTVKGWFGRSCEKQDG